MAAVAPAPDARVRSRTGRSAPRLSLAAPADRHGFATPSQHDSRTKSSQSAVPRRLRPDPRPRLGRSEHSAKDSEQSKGGHRGRHQHQPGRRSPATSPATPSCAPPPAARPVCSLRIACNTRRKNQTTGDWEDKPNFFDVTVWGAQGENCARFLAKGRPVAIDGRLEWREWEDAGRQQPPERRDHRRLRPVPRQPRRRRHGRRRRQRLHPALGRPGRHARLRARRRAVRRQPRASAGDDDIPF